jgi:adenine-specific DNA-methyltransferase
MIKDIINDNAFVNSNSAFLDELQSKLPGFFTADKYDDEGNLVARGNFDLQKFHAALKAHNVDELTSGYQIDFIGKDYARKQAGEKSATVIVPDVEHNQRPENKDSNNLFLTGDNLEVLRHLQSSYFEAVDMIYIDPPYNTGSDGFVYPDTFEYSDQALSDMFGLNETELARLKSIQGKATHSAWLTFIYPRLALAKKLLKDSGLIFISIGDDEQANLKLLCDEVFGESNFIVEFSRVTKKGGKSSDATAKNHDYILLYSKSANPDISGVAHTDAAFRNRDEYFDSRGAYKLNQTLDYDSLGYSSSLDYVIELEGHTLYPGGSEEKFKQRHAGNHSRADWAWRWSKDLFQFGLENGFIVLRTGGDRPRIYTKTYQNAKIERKNNQYEIVTFDRTKPLSTLEFTENEYSNDNATKVIEQLFGSSVFEYTKPPKLIQKMVELHKNKNALVLDFFAGSGTTAQAVIEQNKEDGGERHFMLVQITEPCAKNTVAWQQGYKTIDEISRDRIERVAQKTRDALPGTTMDLGFRHYRFVTPAQRTMDDLDSFDMATGNFITTSGQLTPFGESGFDNMIAPFSAKSLGVAGKASGEETILTTWLLADGYKMGQQVQNIAFAGYNARYVDGTRLYLIEEKWRAEQTRELLNRIGTHQLAVQTVVIYGYSFELESIRELETGLKQLSQKVNLVKRY